MSDNLTAPAAGTVLAADDVGGVFYPRTKISFGADGVATDVSSSAPLPVIAALPTGAAADATVSAMSAKLPATLGIKTAANSFSIAPASDAVFAFSAASLPLPTGAATEATLAATSAKLPATLGIKTAAASLSIAPASDATFPISAAALPLPTGAATEVTLAAASAKLPATLGIKTAANSLSIAPASDAAFGLAASENYIGKVGGDVFIPSVSGLATSVSPAYSTADVIGGKLTITGATRVTGGGGVVQSVALNCKSAQTGAIDLILFSADPAGSTFTDNAALAIAAADWDKIIGVIHLSDWTNLGTPSVVQANNIGMAYKVAVGSTLYGVLVARSGLTFASVNDLNLALRVVPS